MIAEIKSLMREYADWLVDRTQLREIDEYVEITTPYLDRHNDQLQVYTKAVPDGISLTDDGYIINDLRTSGCSIDRGRRKEILESVLNGFGIKREGDALTTRASTKDFAYRKHNLLQAMVVVNDMFYTADATVTHLFVEDVTQWLDSIDVRYIPSVKLAGRTGYDHVFDAAIPKSRSAPERLLKAINRPNRIAAQAFSFAWLDTKDVRPADSEAYAILNDNVPVSAEVIVALENYAVKPVRWSQRETLTSSFAA